MSSENRKGPRYPVEDRVDVYFEQKGIWETQGVNMSEGGILFRSQEPLGLYARAILRLHLREPDHPYLDLDASSVRSDKTDEGYLTAMEFMNLTEADRGVISHYLSRQSTN